MPLGAATLWEQLEKAGIPEVKGVWGFVYGGQPGPFTVISIKQRYAGHSKQALLVAAGASPLESAATAPPPVMGVREGSRRESSKSGSKDGEK